LNETWNSSFFITWIRNLGGKYCNISSSEEGSEDEELETPRDLPTSSDDDNSYDEDDFEVDRFGNTVLKKESKIKKDDDAGSCLGDQLTDLAINEPTWSVVSRS